jgi:ATP-dependent DNA ligase
VQALRTPDASSTARSARSTRRAGELLGDATGQHALAYDVFDVLEVDGEPLVDLPLSERRSGSRSCSTRIRSFSSPARSRTARRCSRRTRAGSRGVMAKRARRRVRGGGADRDWLKIKTHGGRSS